MERKYTGIFEIFGCPFLRKFWENQQLLKLLTGRSALVWIVKYFYFKLKLIWDYTSCAVQKNYHSPLLRNLENLENKNNKNKNAILKSSKNQIQRMQTNIENCVNFFGPNSALSLSECCLLYLNTFVI